jgi:hypothetical protein
LEDEWRLLANLNGFPGESLTLWLEPFLGPALLHAPLTGSASLVWGREGLLKLEAKIEAGAGTVDAPQSFSQAVSFEAARLGLALAPQGDHLEIADFGLSVAGGHIEGSVRIALDSGSDPLASGTTRIRKLPTHSFITLWPLHFAPKTRASVVRIVESGSIEDLQVEFEVGPSRIAGRETDINRLQGKGSFAGISADVRLGLERFHGLGGTAEFDAESLHFTVDSGSWAETGLTDATLHFSDLKSALPALDALCPGEAAE